jgi:hypothetical protein
MELVGNPALEDIRAPPHARSLRRNSSDSRQPWRRRNFLKLVSDERLSFEDLADGFVGEIRWVCVDRRWTKLGLFGKVLAMRSASARSGKGTSRPGKKG